MPEKDPHTWSLASLVIAIGASLAGGAIQYREEMRYTGRFRLGGFIFDMFTSAFVGFLAFWVCRDVLQQPEALCACAAGFAGNMGSACFNLAKHAVANRMGVKEEHFHDYGPEVDRAEK